MKKITIIGFLAVFFNNYSYSQSVGRYSFDFLNTSSNTYTSSLGGVNVSSRGNNIDLFQNNPAAFNPEMLKAPSLNVGFLPGQVTITNLTFGTKIRNTGDWAFGMTYLDYGTINAHDEIGQSLGEEKARDYVLSIGKSHQVRYFRIGVSLKFAGSNLAGYTAYGLFADVGGQFIHPKKDLIVGLNIKNAGFFLKEYTESNSLKAPLDIQFGVTFKPEHMPLKFSFTAYNFVSNTSLYFDEKNTAKEEKTTLGSFDKVFSHVVIGGELLISKPVHLQFGYNHKIRKELSHEEKPGLSGFAFGFDINVKAFRFAYGHGFYHESGGTNYVNLSLRFNQVLKKSIKQ